MTVFNMQNPVNSKTLSGAVRTICNYRTGCYGVTVMLAGWNQLLREIEK